ncbi:MAG TPA: WD40 repeat domain-containing protein, partial [Acidimicrobiia bacterium]|nr:WD40 repeat domain-containing protein [Acidimicrobiia bacterium]
DLGPCGGTIEDVSAETVLVATSALADCTFPGLDSLALWAVDLESGDRTELTPSYLPQKASLSADGSYAAFTDLSGDQARVVVMDTVTGERIFDLDASDDLEGLKATYLINQDASLIIVGSQPWEVWDVTGESLVATYPGHQGSAVMETFGTDGETVYSVGNDGVLRLWNARRGTEIATYPAVGPGRAAITEDGLVLVSDWLEGEAFLLDLTPGETWGVDTCTGYVLPRSLHVVDESLALSAICQTGEWVTFVIDTADRHLVASYSGLATGARDARISPDGTKLVRQTTDEPPQGSEEGTLVGPPVIADLRTGTSVVELDGVCSWENLVNPWDQSGCAEAPETPFPLLAGLFTWSPDSRFVVASDAFSHSNVVWNAETGELLQVLDLCFEGTPSVMFSDDGSEMFTWCAPEDLVVVSTETWEEVDRIPGLEVEGPMPHFLGYNTDQTSFLLLTGAGSQGGGALHFVDAETNEIQKSVEDIHDGSVTSWQMSPDRTRVATGASDGRVEVWDVDGRELEQEFHISSQVQGVAFIDEDHLAVAPESGGVYVYTLDSDELVRIVRESLWRGFTPLECEQYNFGDDCPSLQELRGDG